MNGSRKILKELKTIKKMMEKEAKISRLNNFFMLLVTVGLTLLTLGISFFAIAIFSTYAPLYLILGFCFLGASFFVIRHINLENKKKV